MADEAAARALVDVLGHVEWEAVALAHGYLALMEGASEEVAARKVYERGFGTLQKSREKVQRFKQDGLVAQLSPRERTGSAENPVTKLFPAAVTEQRFLELIETLRQRRRTIDYRDDREAGHSLTDFTLLEGEVQLPINIKNAGTRFEQAASLVRLEPDDCIPIPAYKAHLAVERLPSLLYAVAVDYSLIGVLGGLLPTLFDSQETIVWALLNRFTGGRVKKAEDAFVGLVVRRHWDAIRVAIANPPFHVISARKSIRVLQTLPHRTPGIGLKAWGTSARGEVNVHLSLANDTKVWPEIDTRIVANGLADIVEAVNRKRQELVYDPEI